MNRDQRRDDDAILPQVMRQRLLWMILIFKPRTQFQLNFFLKLGSSDVFQYAFYSYVPNGLHTHYTLMQCKL